MERESETEKEGLREYVKVMERVGYECGQLVRERWKLIALKSAIAKKQGKKILWEKTREVAAYRRR